MMTSDPIADARDLLHAAARLPFMAARSRQWRRRFAEHVSAARLAIHRHVARTAMGQSPIADVVHDLPHLQAALERERAEDQELRSAVDALSEEASRDADVDIWRMIDLGERAQRLEKALERHYDRLVSLVYETTHRELGGEAG